MFVGIAVLVFVLDQLVKYMVRANFSLGESLPVVKGFFHLTYILNPGAAFGIFAHKQFFFVFMAVLFMGVAVYCRKKIAACSFIMRFGIAILVGGAAGNLLDRVLLGAVVDFFDFRIWPVFNIADIAIVLGAGIVSYAIMFEKVKVKN